MIKIQYTKGICILFMTMGLLTGCGKNDKQENITKGMECIKQYEYEAALDSFEAAAVYDEDSELLYRGQGMAYLGLCQYEAAVDSFLKSISYAKGTAENLAYDTNYYLATAYYKMGNYADAEKIYSAILGLRPKELDAYYLRGCTQLKQGYFDSAMIDFEKAFALSPEPVYLVIDAYQEMEAAGFQTEGQAYLQTYITANEKSLQNAQKGMLYYFIGDYANARTFLDGALNQGDAKVSLILGKTYEKLGTLDYAAVVYQTYLDANTPDAAIYNSLGTCLMAQGKYPEALEAFQAGVDMGDSAYIQNLQFNLIVAHEFIGNFQQAKDLMVEYLQRYPNDEKAKKESIFLQTR